MHVTPWRMPFVLRLLFKRSQPNALSLVVHLDFQIRDEGVGLSTLWGKFCRFWWQRNWGPMSSPEINACIVWMPLKKQLSELLELRIKTWDRKVEDVQGLVNLILTFIHRSPQKSDVSPLTMGQKANCLNLPHSLKRPHHQKEPKGGGTVKV
jgi:hypothetical protein